MRIRFTKDGYRFLVGEDTCRVFQRIHTKDENTERAVSHQKRTKLVAKYADDIKEYRKSL